MELVSNSPRLFSTILVSVTSLAMDRLDVVAQQSLDYYSNLLFKLLSTYARKNESTHLSVS